jgi:hypothetical protein
VRVGPSRVWWSERESHAVALGQTLSPPTAGVCTRRHGARRAAQRASARSPTAQLWACTLSCSSCLACVRATPVTCLPACFVDVAPSSCIVPSVVSCCVSPLPCRACTGSSEVTSPAQGAAVACGAACVWCVCVCGWVTPCNLPPCCPRQKHRRHTHTATHTRGGGGGGGTATARLLPFFSSAASLREGQRGNRGDTHAQKRNDQRKR